MMHVIIGTNASGKTLYLTKLLDKLDSVVTNMRLDVMANYKKYNSDRLEALAEYLVADSVEIRNGEVCVVNNFVPFDEEFRVEALKLCKEGEYLVLDEPDAKVSKRCGNMLYAFMRELIPTYKECYVATHRQCLIGEAFCIPYKVGEDGELVQITNKEAYESVD